LQGPRSAWPPDKEFETDDAEIIPIEGESYRKREAELAQKKRRAAP